MTVLLLGVVMLVSLAMIAFGLPGIWLMVLAAVLYGPITGSVGPGVLTIVGVAAIAVVAELLEYTLSMRYTLKYGGSARAGWGAIGGGIVGALVGLPVPIIGSVLGAFAGAFAGALVMELTTGATGGQASRAAGGALLGRAAGIATKSAAGVIMAVWVLLAVR